MQPVALYAAGVGGAGRGHVSIRRRQLARHDLPQGLNGVKLAGREGENKGVGTRSPRLPLSALDLSLVFRPIPFSTEAERA
jgi:hypothetical protein